MVEEDGKRRNVSNLSSQKGYTSMLQHCSVVLTKEKYKMYHELPLKLLYFPWFIPPFIFLTVMIS